MTSKAYTPEDARQLLDARSGLAEILGEAIGLYREFVELHEYAPDRAAWTAVREVIAGLEVLACDGPTGRERLRVTP